MIVRVAALQLVRIVLCLILSEGMRHSGLPSVIALEAPVGEKGEHPRVDGWFRPQALIHPPLLHALGCALIFLKPDQTIPAGCDIGLCWGWPRESALIATESPPNQTLQFGRGYSATVGSVKPEFLRLIARPRWTATAGRDRLSFFAATPGRVNPRLLGASKAGSAPAIAH